MVMCCQSAESQRSLTEVGGSGDDDEEKCKPEEIVTLLRQVEVGVAKGKTGTPAGKEA